MSYTPEPRIHVGNLYLPVDDDTLAALLADGLVREGDSPALYVAADEKAHQALVKRFPAPKGN